MIETIRRNWLFFLPLAVFAFYYTFQNIIGYNQYPHTVVLKFVTALGLSSLSFVMAYILFPVRWIDKLTFNTPTIVKEEHVYMFIAALFTVVMIAACITADRIPIIEALRGATSEELFNDRNNFLRGREGSGQILNYMFAILTQALLPLVLTWSFWKKHYLRYAILAIFSIGTFLTLSKAAFFCVSAPLTALFLLQGRWRAALASVVGFIASVAVLYVLASGVTGAWQAKAQGAPVAPAQVAMPSDTPAKYNVFHERTQSMLIANRILWIPYVTALDWFRYQEERLDGKYVMGQSIRPIAMLMGKDRLYLEREVAELQWGGPSGATSNAVFFADAWLNWGPIGCILYAALLALTIKVISSTGYKPIIAASVLPVWISCFSALPPVFFSAGLGFLLIAALFLRRGNHEA